MMLYLKYFKLRLMTVFQYRASALAGIATQFFWGFMMLFIYTAFFIVKFRIVNIIIYKLN